MKKWPSQVDMLEANDSLRHIHATLLSPATQHRVSSASYAFVLNVLTRTHLLLVRQSCTRCSVALGTTATLN
jgi:hypothetical protein